MEKHAAPPDGSSSNPSSSSSFTTKPVASHATVSCLDKRIRPNRKGERRFFLTSAERKIALPSDSIRPREEEIRRGANSSSKICCLRHVVAARESKKRVRPRRQETKRGDSMIQADSFHEQHPPVGQLSRGGVKTRGREFYIVVHCRVDHRVQDNLTT